MRRAAILQPGGVHEEVVPSLVAALGPGWDVQAWLSEKCRATKGDLFAEIPAPSLTAHYRAFAGRAGWDGVRDEITAFAPEVIIAATFQLDGVADFVDSLRLPAIGVLHNLRKAGRATRVSDMIAQGRCQPLVLADHVRASYLRANGPDLIDRITVVEPVDWGPFGTSDGAVKRIVVPGGVNAENRDFDGLLDALSDTGMGQRMVAAGAVIEILGGGPDRVRLQSVVADRGLSNIVHFTPLGPSGRVPYGPYLAALRQAWALLPLIQLSKRDYRDFKITSALPTAVGFGLPVVLDHWTASVYRAPCVVADVPVAAALDALLSLDDAAHAALRARILAYREDRLGQNRAEMARALQTALSKEPSHA